MENNKVFRMEDDVLEISLGDGYTVCTVELDGKFYRMMVAYPPLAEPAVMQIRSFPDLVTLESRGLVEILIDVD